MLKSLHCYWSTWHCKWHPLTAAWNHHGTQSGPIRSNFSLNNGALQTRWQEHWLYTHLIFHLAFAFALHESRKQHHLEKESQNLTNKWTTKRQIKVFKQKSEFRKTKVKQKESTQTQQHKYNTKKELRKAKRGCIRGNTCRETKEKQLKHNWNTTEQNRGNAKRIRSKRPKGFCTGMQAQLHSPIMQQVLIFTRAGFSWQYMQESL